MEVKVVNIEELKQHISVFPGHEYIRDAIVNYCHKGRINNYEEDEVEYEVEFDCDFCLITMWIPTKFLEFQPEQAK